MSKHIHKVKIHVADEDVLYSNAPDNIFLGSIQEQMLSALALKVREKAVITEEYEPLMRSTRMEAQVVIMSVDEYKEIMKELEDLRRYFSYVAT